MTQKKQHNEALANWDNEGGATRSQGEMRETKGSNDGDGTSAVGRRHERIQQSELPMNYARLYSRALDARLHCSDTLSAPARWRRHVVAEGFGRV